MSLIKSLVEGNLVEFKSLFEARVHELAVEQAESLSEAMTSVVSRVRGGEVQRNVKVANVVGYTIRDGKVMKMSSEERRRRHLAQRLAAKKRQTGLRMAVKRRAISNRKRERAGIA